MSRFYAQTSPGGLVVGVSELSAEVSAPGLIEISEEQASASLLGMLWDGTDFVDDPNPPERPADTREAMRLAQKALAIRELPDTIRFLDSEERGEASKLFPAWRPDGMAVKVGEVYRYQGEAWRVMQAHNTQADWTPPAVPALFEVL
ncbi:MAG: hypothetical protein LC725_08105 [Lentisphaerae bacterium]|nr:hypothetical protein [Lentisphaerota bacterium]